MIYAVKPTDSSISILMEVVSDNVGMTHLGFSRNTRSARVVDLGGIERTTQLTGGGVNVVLSVRNRGVHAGGVASSTIALISKRSMAVDVGPILKAGRGFSIACPRLVGSIAVNVRVLVSSNLLILRIASVSCRTGRVVTVVRINNALGGSGNVGIPRTGFDVPKLARGSTTSVHFNIRRKISFVTTDFIQEPSSVLRVVRVLRRVSTASARVVTGVRGRRNIRGTRRVLGIYDNLVITHNSLNIRVGKNSIPVMRGSLVQGYGLTKGRIVATARVLSSVR